MLQSCLYNIIVTLAICNLVVLHNIIICHDPSTIKSARQTMHTHLRPGIQQLRPPTVQATPSCARHTQLCIPHPSASGDKPRSERTKEPCKNGARNPIIHYTVNPPLPKVTLKPSIQSNHGPLSTTNTSPATRHSSILFMCPNHTNTLSDPLHSPTNPSTHLLTPNSTHSWHSHKISQTPHLKNTHLPSLSTTPLHASAPHNAAGTTALHTDIKNPSLLNTPYSTKHSSQTPHSFSAPHPPSAALATTCTQHTLHPKQVRYPVSRAPEANSHTSRIPQPHQHSQLAHQSTQPFSRASEKCCIISSQ